MHIKRNYFIEHLDIDHWRQFNHINMSLHPRVNIIAGVNGTGKTTLISILSSALGIRDLRRLEYQHTNMLISYFYSLIRFFSFREWFADGIIGNLKLSNGFSYRIFERHYTNTSCTWIPCEDLHGYRCSSDRFSLSRRFYSFFLRFVYLIWYILLCSTIGLLTIALTRSAFQYTILFQLVFAIIFIYISLEFISYIPVSGSFIYINVVQDILHFLKPNYIQQYEKNNVPLVKACLRITSNICPEANTLRLTDDNSRIIILSPSGLELDINQISHGYAAILEIVWRLCLLERFGLPYVVLMDEPEIHLHPGLQRRFLHNLIKSFPNAQFIIATHSPFIMGASSDAHVYILKQDKEGLVSSFFLSDLNKGGSANELLRDAFELTFTQGIWIEDEVRAILKEYIGAPITTALINEMHEKLRVVGLEQMLPEALSSLVSGEWLKTNETTANDKTD